MASPSLPEAFEGNVLDPDALTGAQRQRLLRHREELSELLGTDEGRDPLQFIGEGDER